MCLFRSLCMCWGLSAERRRSKRRRRRRRRRRGGTNSISISRSVCVAACLSMFIAGCLVKTRAVYLGLRGNQVKHAAGRERERRAREESRERGMGAGSHVRWGMDQGRGATHFVWCKTLISRSDKYMHLDFSQTKVDQGPACVHSPC